MSMLDEVRTSGRYALGVGVHNAFTASLAERAGFDVLWLSSLEASTARLLPDINVITFTEMARICREIRTATTLPVFVDADNGYGSDETAVRAAQEFAFSGATAMCIEDNAFPKRNSFYQGTDRSLEETGDFCRRIEAVRRAAGDRLEVIARTEGLVAGLGAEKTAERARAYVEAGADAIFVQTKEPTLGEFGAVLEEVGGLAPVVCTPTALPDTTAEELGVMGVDVIIYANVVMRAITKGVGEVLEVLREERLLRATDGRIAPLEALFELTDAYGWLHARPAR
jgi:phosphoenolpyruvate phosphomutase